jgi:hypothetical protein
MTIWCNHYRAMSTNDTCEAGVPYEQFKGVPHDKRPCFGPGRECPVACGQEVYPSAEEIAAEQKEMEARFQKTVTARQAIVASLGGPWKRGMAGAQGSIPCPVCTTGTLRFSRAGYNGHIHAACTTDDCVNWME